MQECLPFEDLWRSLERLTVGGGWGEFSLFFFSYCLLKFLTLGHFFWNMLTVCRTSLTLDLGDPYCCILRQFGRPTEVEAVTEAVVLWGLPARGRIARVFIFLRWGCEGVRCCILSFYFLPTVLFFPFLMSFSCPPPCRPKLWRPVPGCSATLSGSVGIVRSARGSPAPSRSLARHIVARVSAGRDIGR